MEWINFNDMPEFVADMERIIIKEFEVNEAVSEEEVWELAREYPYVPCFENIYIELLFMHFESLCNEKGLSCKYEVNCLASWFQVEGEDFAEESDYYDLINSLKEVV